MAGIFIIKLSPQILHPSQLHHDLLGLLSWALDAFLTDKLCSKCSSSDKLLLESSKKTIIPAWNAQLSSQSQVSQLFFGRPEAFVGLLRWRKRLDDETYLEKEKDYKNNMDIHSYVNHEIYIKVGMKKHTYINISYIKHTYIYTMKFCDKRAFVWFHKKFLCTY